MQIQKQNDLIDKQKKRQLKQGLINLQQNVTIEQINEPVKKPHSGIRVRRKSVSKSTQREASLPSLFDYTLKFLNDDMAIPKVEKEPLIEKIIEDDYLEN